MGNKQYKGIDISYCQAGINFTKAKASGIDFVIIRIGHGIKIDTEFATHYKGAKSAGINVGGYYYCKALSVAEAEKEAECCYEYLDKRELNYPVFYDMEDNSLMPLTTEQRTAICLAFCNKMTQLGYYTGVYANPSWLENYLDKSQILGKYDLWLAHWISAGNEGQYGQKMWQYGLTQTGGISGDVDGDICYVDYPAILGKTHFKADLIPEQGSTSITNPIIKGDKVKVKQGTTAYDGRKLADFVYSTVYEVLESPKGDRAVIGINGKVTCAIKTSQLTVVNNVNSATSTTQTATFAKGDKVNVKQNATDFNGGKLADFVYDNTYTVLETPKENRVVIGVDGKVTAAVNAVNLIKQ